MMRPTTGCGILSRNLREERPTRARSPVVPRGQCSRNEAHREHEPHLFGAIGLRIGAVHGCLKHADVRAEGTGRE